MILGKNETNSTQTQQTHDCGNRQTKSTGPMVKKAGDNTEHATEDQFVGSYVRIKTTARRKKDSKV